MTNGPSDRQRKIQLGQMRPVAAGMPEAADQSFRQQRGNGQAGAPELRKRSTVKAIVTEEELTV